MKRVRGAMLLQSLCTAYFDPELSFFHSLKKCKGRSVEPETDEHLLRLR